VKTLLLLSLAISYVSYAGVKSGVKTDRRKRETLVKPALKKESKRMKRATEKFPPVPASGASAQ